MNKQLEWKEKFYRQFCYSDEGAKELDWNLFPPILHNGKDRLGELMDFITSEKQLSVTETIEKVKIGLSHIKYPNIINKPDDGKRYYEAHEVFELLQQLSQLNIKQEKE